jgi:hypothetical protein
MAGWQQRHDFFVVAAMHRLAHLEFRLGTQGADDMEVVTVPIAARLSATVDQRWPRAYLRAIELNMALCIVATKNTDMLPVTTGEQDDVTFLQATIVATGLGGRDHVEVLACVGLDSVALEQLARREWRFADVVTGVVQSTPDQRRTIHAPAAIAVQILLGTALVGQRAIRSVAQPHIATPIFVAPSFKLEMTKRLLENFTTHIASRYGLQNVFKAPSNKDRPRPH